ncbi:CzcE family metal-binding protein [Aromatoleum evansii]|uniref:CzcE family metal-binding protein n=2 Tax=Aromatoleum TaxID=551759 RepID=A0ABZ1AX26_AROEV|nr:CzcE family metal-binding protein [Aromatoleum evansii]
MLAATIRLRSLDKEHLDWSWGMIMNRNICRATAISALLFTTASSAIAHTDYSEAGTSHWVEGVRGSASEPTERQKAPYGYESTGVPERILVVDKNTRHINVVQLETVSIRFGGKVVNWTFDAYPRRNFSLSNILPGVDGVTVYVDESPMYRGR